MLVEMHVYKAALLLSLLTSLITHDNSKCATTGVQNDGLKPGSENDSFTERAGEAVPASTLHIFDHARLRYDTADMV